MGRPWQGRREPERDPPPAPYDPECYLCPGNERANGERNPEYDPTFVFTNDFPALLPHEAAGREEEAGLFREAPAQGTSRVICFSPRHDLTLPELPQASIRTVVDVWAEETQALGDRYCWVQVFENKGEIMGCSNPHPHGQIWALDTVPTEPAEEDRRQKAYHDETGRCLLLDYVQKEAGDGERVVVETEDWIAVVPYWAVWPFETLLVPKRHVVRLPELDGSERDGLAGILKSLLTRYDNLFETSFPYSMGWHGAPFGVEETRHWQLHAHFYPPLLRSASIKKFMVGFEMLGEAQRDLTAEAAAERLRGCSEVHYRTDSTRGSR